MNDGHPLLMDTPLSKPSFKRRAPNNRQWRRTLVNGVISTLQKSLPLDGPHGRRIQDARIGLIHMEAVGVCMLKERGRIHRDDRKVDGGKTEVVILICLRNGLLIERLSIFLGLA